MKVGQRIDWQPWSDEAFARARRDDKPVLLSISAVWCHWCHVMDRTSYSDPAVVEAINSSYVPVRVDNDKRPDVNARYNQGGWPTTAFLTPEGALLAGATYLPPEQMRAALEQISEFYHSNREQIAARSAELAAKVRSRSAAPAAELTESFIAAILSAVDGAFDEEFGGFGDAPKFPMIDVLELLLLEWRLRGDQRLYDMLAHSLFAMAGGGTYDHVEGGFFRYSTTRDWSVPHFEKMSEDHAGLVRVLATLAHVTRNRRFREILISTLAYLRSVLRDPAQGFFAGSQDADEEYYALPLDERRSQRAPYVDRTIYANWNAALAGAFVAAGFALEDDAIVAEGTHVLDALHDRMRDVDGLLYHFMEPGGAAQVRGLLTDQAAYLRALLDAHEFTGEARFLLRARETANLIRAHFCAPDGGYFDHAGFEAQLGNLTWPDRPLAENASVADSFLRLDALEEDNALRAGVENTLRIYAAGTQRAGLFAAPFARALRRYLSPQALVRIEGSPPDTADLREAARALPDPLVSIRTNAHAQENAAYYCRANACAAPARTPAELRDAYESVR
jgi:uncharacterized protein YyaL (SSP411 family)